MKKNLLKTTCNKKLKTVINFLKSQKHINPNKKFFPPIEYPDARKTIGKSN